MILVTRLANRMTPILMTRKKSVLKLKEVILRSKIKTKLNHKIKILRRSRIVKKKMIRMKGSKNLYLVKNRRMMKMKNLIS